MLGWFGKRKLKIKFWNKIFLIIQFYTPYFWKIDSHNLYDEHIYVISGVFNDGINNYEKGSYIVNPKGTAHLPQSQEGCTILVTYP